MKKLEIILLTLLLIGAFTVRLYRFSGPIADWHSWRQADTSSVSRNFVKYGFDLLHPRIDNISNVQTDGKYENPKGYFFAEFPLYNTAQAGLYVLLGHFTLEEWGRLVTIFSSLFVMIFIYLLCKKYASKTSGYFAVFFYAFLPFVIYYSRTILPASSMLATLLGSVYFFDLFLDVQSTGKKYLFFCISLFLITASILIMPYALFYALPFLYLLWKKFGFAFFLKWQIYAYLILAITPFVAWRLWMLQYPEGIPANDWLFNGGNIRFTGSFFYWLFAERMGRLILGYWGVALLVIGIIAKKKHIGFFLSFFVSSLVYLTVIARGNVQHDYYQLVIMPSVVILLGLGSEFLFVSSKEVVNTYAGWVLLCVCCLFSIAFGWYSVRDFFNINNPNIVVAGKAVDRVTPKNAKILTFYNGDSTLLYQTNRFGWASLEKPLEDMIKMGADYIVIPNPTPNDLNGFGKDYKVVAVTPQYLIINLHHKQ
ncbi:MAG TPA: glycosyltransferase family 39 protein [Candidatus Eisenbacteria bacterium]|nr:glycosyltransferase family 39 protein [Candidatus Eisenbacteria bacterium]